MDRRGRKPQFALILCEAVNSGATDHFPTFIDFAE